MTITKGKNIEFFSNVFIAVEKAPLLNKALEKSVYISKENERK